MQLTDKQAVKWLKSIRTRQTGGRDEYDNARRAALDMAVDAIENRAVVPCDVCKYNKLKVPEVCAKCPAESVLLCSC